jgi:hypothetical protein
VTVLAQGAIRTAGAGLVKLSGGLENLPQCLPVDAVIQFRWMAKCGKCGVEFDADEIRSRVPCPACGETVRILEADITLATQARDHAMLELRRNERTIAFRESERDGRVTWADEENNVIITSVTGTSPRGETDTLSVCRTLVRKLGGFWAEPVEPVEQNSDDDCVSRNKSNNGDMLRIQVVRGIVDDGWWHELATSGTNAKSGTAEELADIIVHAVRKKFERTPQAHRAKLVLAVDANRLPGLTLDSVVSCTREKHGKALDAMRFRSVWLVGPSISRTHRLDVERSSH